MGDLLSAGDRSDLVDRSDVWRKSAVDAEDSAVDELFGTEGVSKREDEGEVRSETSTDSA